MKRMDSCLPQNAEANFAILV